MLHKLAKICEKDKVGKDKIPTYRQGVWQGIDLCQCFQSECNGPLIMAKQPCELLNNKATTDTTNKIIDTKTNEAGEDTIYIII